MVELINHKYNYTIVMRNVPEARKVINKHLQFYINYEFRLKENLFDIDLTDKPPEPETFSILVNDVLVWTNKHLF